MSFKDFSIFSSGGHLVQRRGWSWGAMVLDNLPMPGVLLIWIRVGQGLTVLAVGEGVGCL